MIFHGRCYILCFFLLLDIGKGDSRFDIYWNAPTFQCKKSYGIDMEPVLKKFGIIVNEGDRFQGNSITIFYEKQLGLYPSLEKGKAVNGGLPLLGNLDEHLKKAKLDIEKVIPDENFSGLGVIDWESWRPIYHRNWGSLSIYKNKTQSWIAKNNPGLQANFVTILAEKEWENSAKDWMLRTIELAKELRPKAKWCYYLFPDCYNYEGESMEGFTCPKIQQDRNDKLSWMWEASTALCPSIYLKSPMLKSLGTQKRLWRDYHRVHEAFRVASPVQNVYPYMNYYMEKAQKFLPEEEFSRIMTQIAAAGSDGVVIWGSSESVRTKEHCEKLQNYMLNVIGPVSQRIASNYEHCSKDVCNGHGKCTWEPPMSLVIWKLYIKTDQAFEAENIICRCSENYSGRFCENNLENNFV